MGRERSPAAPAARPFQVGNWSVDPETDTLAMGGRSVKLEPRAMRLLVALSARPGEVHRSDDLLDAVWPGVVVTGHSLCQAIGELRSALKADADTPAFIANVPRKGYRLVAPVSHDHAPTVAVAASSSRIPQPATRTIAVLPFRDLGLPAEARFLREVLLGDLVLELSRQPGLATIARGTMLAYDDRSVPARRIAEELGARYVVDGTIARLGDRLAIACELTDTAGASVLASESVEVPAEQWPALGQRVVGRLARALRLEVSAHASRTADAASPGGGTALELAMRAWVELYCRGQSAETNDRAWAWAKEAVRGDPSIGAAWNALGYCEYRAAQYDWHSGERTQLLADAVSHVERATALSPADPDAHYTLGLANFTRGETARGEASLRHCLDISASYAPAYGLLGLVRIGAGHPEEAGEWCRHALALSPREPLRAVWHWAAACGASMLGRDEEALEQASRGIAANPDYPTCYVAAAVSLHRLGRRAEAARCVAFLQESAFNSVERVRQRAIALRTEPWGSALLADLGAAGLPER